MRCGNQHRRNGTDFDPPQHPALRCDPVAGGDTDVATAVIVLSVMGGLMLFVWLLCGWAWFRLRRRRPLPRVHHRLARFAAANGMSYSPGPTNTIRDAPFRRRGSLNLYRVLQTPGDRGVEFANYELARSSSTNTAPQFGGYCALRLPIALPNIILRSVDGPKRPLQTSAVLRESQLLSLEGDFDRYYRRYCPTGYERDALYLFTPDVMGRLVDNLRGLDIEIVDDWMYLISARDLITDQPDGWEALAGAVDALDDRIERWGRWRDQHAALDPSRDEGDPAPIGIVEEPERRLRTGWSAGTILIVGFVSLCFAALVIAINLPAGR